MENLYNSKGSSLNSISGIDEQIFKTENQPWIEEAKHSISAEWLRWFKSSVVDIVPSQVTKEQEMIQGEHVKIPEISQELLTPES